MITRTPYLSGLILLSAAFPGQLFRVAMGFAVRPGRNQTRPAWVALLIPAALLLTAALVWYVAPESGVTRAPGQWYWLAVALAVGVAAPAWEAGLGAALAWARRRRVTGIRLHQQWTNVGTIGVAAAVLVAIAEEVIFRGVGIYLLTGTLGAPIAMAVVITALAYGLNHLYFGWLTVLQKCITGIVLGGLFVAAGYSVLVPMVAHVVQNLVVLLVLPRLGARGDDR